MIVKDEEHCIATAIGSVALIADQVVVVDTGSSDGTVTLARSLGAKVYEHEWRDDFSAARNESLRRCRSDWIFVLDADEVVAQEDLDRLRSLTETRETVAYRFVSRNYGFNRELTGWTPCDPRDPYARDCPGWHPSIKTRLFRRHPEIRFEGRIHELVMKSLDNLGVARVLCDIPIHHYGRAQSPEQFRRKQTYYLELARKKIQEDPADAKSYFELANQLHELGDYEGAAESYKRALEIEPNSAVILANLGSIYHKLGDFCSAKEAYQRALELEPNRADTMRNLGVTIASMGEYERAIEHIAKAAELQPDLFDVNRALGTVLEAAGRTSEALTSYRRAIETSGPAPALLESFTRLALQLGQVEGAETVLRELLDSYPDDAALVNSLGEIMYHDGRVEEAGDLFERATQLDEQLAVAWNNLGVLYVSMNRLSDAVDCFKRCLTNEPDNAGARANLLELQKIL
jgi:Flp pilus assembly protein TadD